MLLAIRLALGSLIVSSLVVVGFASSAEAITCTYSSTSTAKFKTCRDWDYYKSGSSARYAYSSYKYQSTAGSPEIYTAIDLKDTRADGKCAWIRATKTNSPYNFDVYQASACGQGTVKQWTAMWTSFYMASGTLRLFLCTGRTDCTQIWMQNIP